MRTGSREVLQETVKNRVAASDSRAAMKIERGFNQLKIQNTKLIRTKLYWLKATPHNSARVIPEKNRVLTKAFFRRHTLCMARKSDKVRARFFREAPMADCAVLP